MSEKEKGKGEDLQDLPLPMAKQKPKETCKGCPDAQPSTEHVALCRACINLYFQTSCVKQKEFISSEFLS